MTKIELPGRTIIMNGGDPLENSDAPANWEIAEALTKKWNETHYEGEQVRWRFDCGFKLDFDGGLINICSRFYPPTELNGEGWDGTISIMNTFGKTIIEKKLDCKTLDELIEAVNEYTKKITDHLTKSLTNFHKENGY